MTLSDVRLRDAVYAKAYAGAAFLFAPMCFPGQLKSYTGVLYHAHLEDYSIVKANHPQRVEDIKRTFIALAGISSSTLWEGQVTSYKLDCS